MKLVPWDHDITKEDFDGLFLSNGPGDPSLAGIAINNLKKVSNIPGAIGYTNCICFNRNVHTSKNPSKYICICQSVLHLLNEHLLD